MTAILYVTLYIGIKVGIFFKDHTSTLILQNFSLIAMVLFGID